MKRFIFSGFISFVILVFIGCASINHTMDGVLPYEYFQSLKKSNERLVFFAPVLAKNHSEAFLYLITNPEDIQKAHDIVNNTTNASVNELNKLLNNFSPVVIRSTTQAQYGNGIAIFNIPENINNFFFVYLKFRINENFSFNSKTDILSGIIPFPTESEYIFIGFTENDNEMDAFAIIGQSELRSIYNDTNGLYGIYLSKKLKQIGFNEVTTGIRFRFLQDREKQWKAEGRNVQTGLFDEFYSGRSFQEKSELEAFKETSDYNAAVVNHATWKRAYDIEQNRINTENRVIQNRNNVAKSDMERRAQSWLSEIKIEGLRQGHLPANAMYEERFARGGNIIQAQITAILLVDNREYARHTFYCQIEQLLQNNVGDYNPNIRY